MPMEGVIILSTMVGTSPQWMTVQLEFLMMKIPSVYNAILRCPSLNAFKPMISTYYLLMKFLTKYGIRHIRGNQATAC